MNIEERASKIEHLLVKARLYDLQMLMQDGQERRLQRIAEVIRRLDKGTYLIGTGPYTQGVMSVMTDEVIIGRYATPLEESKEIPVDVSVNDAVTLTPREVSRAHCSVYRRPSVEGFDYWVVDRGSTCGTYVNGAKIQGLTSLDDSDITLASKPLTDGDVISLGPTHVNTFLFCHLS